jgi:hypothetical protein
MRLGLLIIDHDKAATSERDRLQQAVVQCSAAALRLADQPGRRRTSTDC